MDDTFPCNNRNNVEVYTIYILIRENTISSMAMYAFNQIMTLIFLIERLLEYVFVLILWK